MVDVLVSDEDYEKLAGFKWHIDRGYAKRNTRLPSGKHGTQYMHREIMDPPPGMVVDHIDHDGLNNTRENLRVVTQQQNVQHRRAAHNSTSGVRGVSWCKRNNKWRSQVFHRGKSYSCGYYDNIEEAAAAAEAKRTELGFLAA